MIARVRVAIVVGALVLAVSCAGSSEVSGDRRVVGGVTATFTVRPAHVDVGKTVRITLRLTNVTGNAVELTFPTSQQYDFWIVRGDNEVWRWSDERIFTQAVEKRTIVPQGTLTLSEPWIADAAGSYVVHGEAKADGYGSDLTGKLTVGG